MSSYSVQENTCNCHPETCSCDPWAVVSKGQTIAKFFHREGAESAAAILNAMQQQLAAAQAEAQELRQSRRDAIDMANDNALLASTAMQERDELRKESERLEAENQQLLSTFRHSHHRSDNGDSCAQCGLDLRHPIHNRTLASRGDK